MQRKLQQRSEVVAEEVIIFSHFLVLYTAHCRSRIMSSTSQWEVDTFCQSRSRRSSINHSVCDGKCVFLPNEDPLLRVIKRWWGKWSNMRGLKGTLYSEYQMQKCSVWLCMALYGSEMQTKGNVQKIWKPEDRYCILIIHDQWNVVGSAK